MGPINPSPTKRENITINLSTINFISLIRHIISMINQLACMSER